MSVTLNNLVLYGSANMVSADGTTTGGAVAFNTRVFFADLAATGTVNYVSSSASDTATTITITGRDSTGVIKTETKTLTGQTAITGAQSFQRLLQGAVGGTTAAGDVAAISATAIVTGTAQTAANTSGTTAPYITLQSGQGASCSVGQVVVITNNLPSGAQAQLRYITSISGDQCFINRDWGTVPTSSTTYTVNAGMLFELSPNQVTSIIRPFDNCAADVSGGSTRNFYAKVFAVNNNTTTTLTGASIVKQVDPSGLYAASGQLNFALCSALNDTGTVANRQTAPVTGITAFSSGAAPQTINVPSPQNLASGAAPNAAGAQGIWLQLQLPAGAPAFNVNVDMRTNGTTT